MTKKNTFFQERAHKKQENITKKILIVTKMRLRECVDQIFLQVFFLWPGTEEQLPNLFSI